MMEPTILSCSQTMGSLGSQTKCSTQYRWIKKRDPDLRDSSFMNCMKCYQCVSYSACSSSHLNATQPKFIHSALYKIIAKGLYDGTCDCYKTWLWPLVACHGETILTNSIRPSLWEGAVVQLKRSCALCIRALFGFVRGSMPWCRAYLSLLELWNRRRITTLQDYVCAAASYTARSMLLAPPKDST